LENNMLAQIDLNAIQSRGLPTLKKEFMFSSGLGALISSLVPWVFGLAGMALLLYLIMGGLQLMTAKGDPKAVQAAQGKITNAVIGFVIVIASSVIVALIGEVFSIAEFKDLFGTTTP
jgi:hypothetical protein